MATSGLSCTMSVPRAGRANPLPPSAPTFSNSSKTISLQALSASAWWSDTPRNPIRPSTCRWRISRPEPEFPLTPMRAHSSRPIRRARWTAPSKSPVQQPKPARTCTTATSTAPRECTSTMHCPWWLRSRQPDLASRPRRIRTGQARPAVGAAFLAPERLRRARPAAPSDLTYGAHRRTGRPRGPAARAAGPPTRPGWRLSGTLTKTNRLTASSCCATSFSPARW